MLCGRDGFYDAGSFTPTRHGNYCLGEMLKVFTEKPKQRPKLRFLKY